MSSLYSYHFSAKVRIRDYGIPCSNKHGIIVTHLLAIDNHDSNDEVNITRAAALKHRLFE
jgi:hypothetical protein